MTCRERAAEFSSIHLFDRVSAAWLVGVVAVAMPVAAVDAAEITVRNSIQLQVELARPKPGMTLLLAPGEYRGDIHLHNLAGTEKDRIVIRGADPEKPPVFRGGKRALQLSDCRYLTLSNLIVRGFSVNGINVDDAGSIESPAHHVILEDLQILETGPRGNHDGLKLSGLDDFVVRRCRFEGWGGSAIDMVGCHRGIIEDCRFLGRAGFTQQTGLQIKGGSAEILVHRCFFKQAGERAVNIGGSTDLEFFRPRIENYEARDVTVAGNRFVGSPAAIAWVTARGGHVHHNTIVNPERWVLRILQESDDRRFKACHGGRFENNLIVFDRRLRTFVNVGGGTAADSFTFRRNAWFQTDGKRRPDLPTAEPGGLYQVDPRLSRVGTPEMKIGSRDPRFKDVGADHYRKPATK